MEFSKSEDSKMEQHFYIKSSEGDSFVDSDSHACRHRAASPLCPVPHSELPCCRVSGLGWCFMVWRQHNTGHSTSTTQTTDSPMLPCLQSADANTGPVSRAWSLPSLCSWAAAWTLQHSGSSTLQLLLFSNIV